MRHLYKLVIGEKEQLDTSIALFGRQAELNSTAIEANTMGDARAALILVAIKLKAFASGLVASGN